MSGVRRRQVTRGARPASFDFQAVELGRYDARTPGAQDVARASKEELQNPNHVTIKKLVCVPLGGKPPRKSKGAVTVVEVCEGEPAKIIGQSAKASQRQAAVSSRNFVIEDIMPEVESPAEPCQVVAPKIRASSCSVSHACTSGSQNAVKIPNPALMQRNTSDGTAQGPFSINFLNHGSKQGVQYRMELFLNFKETDTEFMLLRDAGDEEYHFSSSPIFAASVAGSTQIINYQFGPQDAGQYMSLLIATKERAFCVPITDSPVERVFHVQKVVKSVYAISRAGSVQKSCLEVEGAVCQLQEGAKLERMVSGRVIQLYRGKRNQIMYPGLEDEVAVCDMLSQFWCISQDGSDAFVTGEALQQIKDQYDLRLRPFAECYLLAISNSGPLMLCFDNPQSVAEVVASYTGANVLQSPTLTARTQQMSQVQQISKGRFIFSQTELAFPGTMQSGERFAPAKKPEARAVLLFGIERQNKFYICGTVREGAVIPSIGCVFQVRLLAVSCFGYQWANCSVAGDASTQILELPCELVRGDVACQTIAKVNTRTMEMLLKTEDGYIQKRISDCDWVGWKAMWDDCCLTMHLEEGK